MARTFNRAYDQADRILNGSGLSSIVYRQGAGRIATDAWNRIPNYMKQYGKGIVNKILYETTGKKLSDTTREDLTKGEVAALEKAMSKAIVTGEGEFKGFGTTHKDWASSMAKEGVGGSSRKDIEALVGGATVSWNPETGEYEINDSYDFKDYGWTLPEILQGKAFPSNPLFGIALGLGHKLVGEAKDEKYWDPTFKGKEQGLYRNAITGKIETGLENPGKFRTRHVPYPGALKTRIGIRPQKLQDISEKHDFFGVEDRNLSGLEGYSEETSPSGVTTSFIDDMAIDTTSGLKHGGQTMPGGLSGINKSININGQPHSLAWINPGEASALKAMGGSGKKVDGIPAYFDEWSMGGEEAEQQMADVFHDVEGAAAPAPVEYDYDTPSYQQLISPEAQADLGSATTYQDGVTSASADTTYDSDVKDDYQSNEEYRRLTKQDFLDGLHSNKLNPLINALYASGMINDQVGDYIASLSGNTISSMMDAYDEGYSFGGPMGTLRGLSRDQGTDYTKKLKLKKFAKELKDLRDKGLSGKEYAEAKGELFSKYQDIAKEYGANITENKRFKGMYSGLEEETADREGFMPKVIGAAAKYGLLPGSFATAGIAGIANLLTDLAGVVGEFTTKEGQSYRLMEDGTLVEPDMYTPSQSDNDPMASIQKPRPVRQASVSEEVDKPLTGIAAELDKRSEVASVVQSRQAQFDNIASIFGREEAAKMLNLPENIFA